MYDDDADPIDEPFSASIHRVFAQSPYWWRGPPMPSIAAGWLAFYVVARPALVDGWKPAPAVLGGVIAAAWLGIFGITNRSPNQLRRHTAHYVGVTMLGIAICGAAGAAAGALVAAVR